MRLVPLLLCCVLSTAAWAQLPSASDAPLQASPLPKLEVGQSLRVVRQQGPLEGRLLESSARSLTLEFAASGHSPEQVPLSEVVEISVRKRSPGYGALIGTGAGIFAGAIFGLSECDGSEQCGLSAGAGALGGAVLGAGVGALFGLFVQRWDRVYERAPPPSLPSP